MGHAGEALKEFALRAWRDDGPLRQRWLVLDGSEWPCPCTNRDHGCGYVKPDGTIGPTYDIFATRSSCAGSAMLTRQPARMAS